MGHELAVLALEDGHVFEGRSFGRASRGHGRGGVQHRPVRVPGGPDRSLVRRADRHHDLSPHRQLRGQSRGRRVGAPPGGRLRGAGSLHRGLVVARFRRAAPVPRRERDRRDQRDRHPRPDPPPADPRGQARGHLHRGARQGRARGSGSRLPLHGGARPRPRGHLRRGLPLRRRPAGRTPSRWWPTTSA